MGNHEFDHGVEGLVPFLETLNTTMLVANMDSTHEPDLTGKYQNSMIIERSNRKIGVIGVILETTYVSNFGCPITNVKRITVNINFRIWRIQVS